jgi:hypothetical protein
MRKSPYKEQGRTLVTQVSVVMARVSTRGSLSNQSVSCLIPDKEPFFNIDINIGPDEPFEILGVKHLIYVKTSQKLYIHIEKEGNSIKQEIDGLFILQGSIEGLIKITSASKENVPCNLLYA